MSQLADLTDVLRSAPLPADQQAKLFFEILEVLEWSIDGVNNTADALVYLSLEKS